MEELLPAKDIQALFVSELFKDGRKMLVRKEVYIKNGDKVRNVGSSGGPRSPGTPKQALFITLSSLMLPTSPTENWM